MNTNAKREITTEWTPHGSVDEEIVFRATVAKTFAVFWPEVDSKPMRVRGDDSMSSSELVFINFPIDFKTYSGAHS